MANGPFSGACLAGPLSRTSISPEFHCVVPMVKFWPVFTGASRGLLVFSMQPTDNGDGFEITYESRAPYTTFIHKHRPRNKRPPKVLILDAGNRVVQRMFNELERS